MLELSKRNFGFQTYSGEDQNVFYTERGNKLNFLNENGGQQKTVTHPT
jgi:hypothetical protein